MPAAGPAAGSRFRRRRGADPDAARGRPGRPDLGCSELLRRDPRSRRGGSLRLAGDQLKSLEARLAETLKKLEERKAELQLLTDQRAAEVKQAEARMTDIFARMRPDAAALQLSAMDQGVAVAVLSKLPARAASAVLNEMEASRAAQLAEVMGGRRALPTSSPTGVQTR